MRVRDRTTGTTATIPAPNGRIANLCFGGPDRSTLFATCGDKVYKLKTKGADPSQPPIQPAPPQL